MNLFFVKFAYASLDTFLVNANRLIFNPLVKLLFAVAGVIFLYGVAVFIMNAENEEKRATGRMHMLWGIVGLGIMVGVWSILNLTLNTLGISGINPQKQEVKLDDYKPKLPS